MGQVERRCWLCCMQCSLQAWGAVWPAAAWHGAKGGQGQVALEAWRRAAGLLTCLLTC